MNFFTKKQKQSQEKLNSKEEILLKGEVDIYKDSSERFKEHSSLERGTRSMRDILAPNSVDRSDETCLMIGDKYVRSFVLNGYPNVVSVGWLDTLYNHESDMDVSVYINPADERESLDELTYKIVQLEAQLEHEMKSGSIKHVTKLKNQIQQLYQQREKIEMNYESMFHMCLISNLYCDSKEELTKETQKLDNKIKGRKMDLSPAYLRQDECYKSCMPFGVNYMNDMYRNMNSGALTASFPFYNSEISHNDGIFFGLNLSTGTPIFIDFYDRNILTNSNLTVFGASGSGKTFCVSLMTMRSVLKDIRTVIIDPEGEYLKLTAALGGKLLQISPDSDTRLNPFDIEEEELPDGKKVVKVKDKVSDLLNLIAVMVGGLDGEQLAAVSFALSKVYESYGINEDPRSLYITQTSLDKETGEFYHSGKKKTMPTFSDFYKTLEEYSRVTNSMNINRLVTSLTIFKKGNVYDMFDCHTSENIKDLFDAPIITFDVSKLEESVLRPIGMYISLTWTWEKFVKKNPKQKKRVVIDEAWMLVNPSMQGYEYTSNFMEVAARRIRKRNGGLLIASQGFSEFANNPQGKAVLTNASANIFLRTDSTDIDAVQATFKLSDGEKFFLMGAKRGEALIKMQEESTVAYAMPFGYEEQLISNTTIDNP